MDNTLCALIGIGGAASVFFSIRSIRNILNGGEGEELTTANLPIQVAPRDQKILDEQVMTFKVVSQLWREHDAKTVKFEDLAKLWCDPPTEQKTAPQEIKFTHPEIAAFWREKILGKPFFTAVVEIAVRDILELLDRYGDCPSVVDKHKDEPEKMYQGENNVYKELERIPLYLHTLHAAEEAITRAGAGALVPKLVIAMLAHDLGKLPAFYGRYYQSSTHPFGSVSVVETLASVTSLRYFPEIKEAIRNHHLQSAELFDVMVRECDQTARRKEISGLALAATAGAGTVTSSQAVKPSSRKSGAPKVLAGQLELLVGDTAAPPPPEPKLETEAESVIVPTPTPFPLPIAAPKNVDTPVPVATDQGPPEEIPTDVPAVPLPAEVTSESPSRDLPAGEETQQPVEAEQDEPSAPSLQAACPVGDDQHDRTRVKRQLVDISAWFKPERIITELAGVVNTRYGNERFWSALELGGYVYFRPQFFWIMIERHANKHSAVLAAAAFEQDRDDIMFSVIRQLSKLDDVVATEFIGTDRFGAMFLHNPQDATDSKPAIKHFLVVLRSSAFAQYSDSFPKRLSAAMLRTKEIVPMYPVKAPTRKPRAPEDQAN